MKIPKYIENLLEKRSKAIKTLRDTDNEIGKWLDMKRIESSYIPVQIQFYTRDDHIRDAIKRTPNRNDPLCDCYHFEYGYGQCWGTKERDSCNCHGNTKYCDFYPRKRGVKE